MLIRKLILCIMLGLMFSDTQSEQNQPLPLPQTEEVCEELPIDIWIRPSNDEQNFGNLMYLDMSRGWSGTDGVNVLISVIDLNSGNPIMLIFPLNNWFEMDYSIYIPPTEPEEEEFDLEEYLKKNKGKGFKIAKNN